MNYNVDMVDLHKQPDENEEQYIWRLGRAKDSGQLDMDWTGIAEIINKECREDIEDYRNESAYRKPYQQSKRFYEAGVFKDLTAEQYIKLMQEEKREVIKEKQKLRDERTDYQRSMREDARRESFVDNIERVFTNTIGSLEFKDDQPIINSDEDMIICLSDLHAGIEVKNWWNTYDSEILKDRLNKYLLNIREIQNLHNCKECLLVLGGDALSGLIHPNLRLQNNEDVIQQLKLVIDYIGDFIKELQSYFQTIKVYGVAGNHSRISPSKEESLKGENLEEMLLYCLNLKFANNTGVKICEDLRIDNTIGCFRTRGGKLFYLVHGDKDSVSNVVQNLTLMTGVKPDGIIMGHRHHNAMETVHGVKIIQCGCVVGTDDYCVDKRITGKPEQVCIITDNKQAVKCFYDVEL